MSFLLDELIGFSANAVAPSLSSNNTLIPPNSFQVREKLHNSTHEGSFFYSVSHRNIFGFRSGKGKPIAVFSRIMLLASYHTMLPVLILIFVQYLPSRSRHLRIPLFLHLL